MRCAPRPLPSGRSSALCVLAVVGFFTWVTYPNYDSYYSLLWGQEVLSREKPSFEAYRAPTEHPLAIVFGAALSLLGQGADRVMVLITLFMFVALAAGTYRLGRLCFTPFVGALAAFLVLTRFDFPSLAVRAYLDIPFMAAIVWAGALEVARPRRGTVVFLLLAAAGLLRPEAWILSGVYFLWMSWDADWSQRFRYAALTAIAPLLWAATDFVVTGDPLFSLTSTKDLAAELQRTKSGGDVLSALPGYLRGTVKTPVYFAGLLGLAIAIWKFPLRTIVPLVLFLAGAFTFVATGIGGPVGDRALPARPVGDDDAVRRRRDRWLDHDPPRNAPAPRVGGGSGGDHGRRPGIHGRAAAQPRALQQRALVPRRAGAQPSPAARDRRGRARRCGAARCPSRRTS